MNQFRYSNELTVVDLFLDFTVGASGAPTLKASSSLGIASITRVSAGKYTVALTQPMVRLLGCDPTFISTAPAASTMSVSSVANVASATAPSITINFQLAAGTPTDPASGEEILVAMTFSKSNSI